jgi:ABC-type antimicrobial peptide transport system permease subunit
MMRIDVMDGFFAVTGMRLQRGRLPTPDEIAGNAPIAVVTQAFADRIGDAPLGSSVRLSLRGALQPGEESIPPVTVIGIIDDIRWTGDDRRPTLAVITPMRPTGYASSVWGRVAGPADAFVRTLTMQRRVLRIAPGLERISPLSAVFEADPQERLLVWLAVGITVIALALAGLGFYGMVSYAIIARARELALREALGATRGRVVGLVMRGAAVQAAIGVCFGAVIAIVVVTQLVLRAWLFAEPLVLATAAAAVFTALTVIISSVGPLRGLWRRDVSAVMRDS